MKLEKDIISFNVDGKNLVENIKTFKEEISEDSDILVRMVSNDGGRILIDIAMFGLVTEPAIAIDILDETPQTTLYEEFFNKIPNEKIPQILFDKFTFYRTIYKNLKK
jgi:hypothetical protein